MSFADKAAVGMGADGGRVTSGDIRVQLNNFASNLVFITTTPSFFNAKAS